MTSTDRRYLLCHTC